MSMRRSNARSKQAPIRSSLEEFGWDRAAVATLRHSTLPWPGSQAGTIELDAVPLSESLSRGTRDRLSLLGQYAAHVAFLKFAGFYEESFRPEEWAVVFRRGEDCRLVRLCAATVCESEDDGELALMQAAATFLGAPSLPVLKLPWGKAEHVYHELDRLLRNESRADISWFRRSATGSVLAPGVAGLRALLSGHSVRADDTSALEALPVWSAMDGSPQHIVVGGPAASPLIPYSAFRRLLQGIAGAAGSPAAIAEKILASSAQTRPVLVIAGLPGFDRQSQEIVKMLINEGGALTWLVIVDSPESEALAERVAVVDAGGARHFLLSSRAGHLPGFMERLEAVPPSERREWLERWVRTDAFSRFLDGGAIAPSTSEEALKDLGEPRRSYLAAVALVGREVNRATAEKLLRELGSALPLEQIVLEPVASLTLDRIVFGDEIARETLVRSLDGETRRSLSRLAATLVEGGGDQYAAAKLYWTGDDPERARSLLESIPWWPDEWKQTLLKLDAFPEAVIRESDMLCDVYARAGVRAGRYRRARSFADLLPVPRRDHLCALAERRLGNYAMALELLTRGRGESFEPLLLEGELLRLTGDTSLAARRFARCLELADSREQRVELGFQMALLSFDIGEPPDDSWISLASDAERYFVERCLAYRHLSRRDYAEASAHAAAALECATDVPQKIDAALDVMEAAFLAGSWDEARHRARQALAIVEETEGDRAAGGILFLLAYLCADEGQWQQSARKIERLRDFYARTRDPVRLREIDLLEAHLALGRGELTLAAEKAHSLVAGGFSAEIREAAALVLDEISWLAADRAELVSHGDSACIELTERHLMQKARRHRHSTTPLRSPFARALLAWESRGATEPPLAAAKTGAEKLQLFRSLLAARARGAGGLDALIEQRGRELGVELEALQPPKKAPELAELRFLQELAVTRYPFPAAAIGGLQWRFVTRNRLGQWSESGSLPPQPREAIEAIARDGGADWMPSGDDALLYVEGLDGWSPGSRRSAGELFRLRSENFNLRRAIAQDDEAAVRDTPQNLASGVAGQCMAIRELMALASKISRRDVPVCVLGESGTGKELVARAIHRESNRKAAPFTAVNCAALPEHLVESELFGHVRGAFTGADRDHAGLIESSDGGTLFLDEIGEMPLAAQAKLLRFLQEGEFRRVGDARLRQADVRIVAATNRKLEQFIDDGKFREDLYYRIRGVELKVPPLRDRGLDITLLARHFLAAERAKHRAGPDRFAPEVEQILLSYGWPGNVRELQNTVRAAHAIAANAREIELEHLPERLRSVVVTRVPSGTYFEELLRFRKTLVERSLQQANGNQNQAAKLLGMSRQALAYQIRELGILVTRER